jgi:Bacterial regulatory helix-turn-helix protein, lysR family
MRVGQTLPFCIFWNNQAACKAGLRLTQFGAPMIEALTTFVNVTAAGSFSRVAKPEDVAVSSITRRIDWLESELGAKLFSRSSRRLDHDDVSLCGNHLDN